MLAKICEWEKPHFNNQLSFLTCLQSYTVASIETRAIFSLVSKVNQDFFSFYFTLLFDWSRKVEPPSQPIKWKYYNQSRDGLSFSWTMLVLAVVITLAMVLQHVIERLSCPIVYELRSLCSVTNYWNKELIVPPGFLLCLTLKKRRRTQILNGHP